MQTKRLDLTEYSNLHIGIWHWNFFSILWRIALPSGKDTHITRTHFFLCSFLDWVEDPDDCKDVEDNDDELVLSLLVSSSLDGEFMMRKFLLLFCLFFLCFIFFSVFVFLSFFFVNFLILADRARLNRVKILFCLYNIKFFCFFWTVFSNFLWFFRNWSNVEIGLLVSFWRIAVLVFSIPLRVLCYKIFISFVFCHWVRSFNSATLFSPLNLINRMRIILVHRDNSLSVNPEVVFFDKFKIYRVTY